MPITPEKLQLAIAVIDFVKDVGVEMAEGYFRHKEQEGQDVTAEELRAMIKDYRPTREILAAMGIDY